MPGLATHSLSTRALHDLDGVCGGVLRKDRLAKVTGREVVAEFGPGAPHGSYGCGDVLYVDHNPVPAAGRRLTFLTTRPLVFRNIGLRPLSFPTIKGRKLRRICNLSC